jgi:hypothetical protein
MPSPLQPSATWRKSRHSGSGNACVEVAQLDVGVAVRDSRDPHGSRLLLSRVAWSMFIVEIKQRAAHGTNV